MSKPAAILFSLSFVCLSGADERGSKLVNLVDNIYIECPEDVSVTKDFPVEDFMLARLSMNGQSFLTAYVGNHPRFPKCEGSVKQRTVNTLPGKDVKCEDEQFASDILVDLDLYWPRYVHFMLRGSSAEDEAMWMQIVSSVHVRSAEAGQEP